MSNENNTESLAMHFPYVILILAQISGGVFFILMIGPLLYFFATHTKDKFTLDLLIQIFPLFWGKLLKVSTNSWSSPLIFFGISFPLGICVADFFYRLGRMFRYINDLNLDDPDKDATEEQDIELFKIKCHLQKYPWLLRVWDWEQFQSSLLFYAEGTCALFWLMFTIAFIILGFKPNSSLIIAFVIEILSIILFLIMRKARQGKYQSFRIAHKAIKMLIRERETTI